MCYVFLQTRGKYPHDGLPWRGPVLGQSEMLQMVLQKMPPAINTPQPHANHATMGPRRHLMPRDRFIGVRKGESHQFSSYTCHHENCTKQRLKGRKHCFDHELETEEAEFPSEPVVSDTTIYFIGLEGNDSVVKIGKSTDLQSRLSGIQTANHQQIVLLATVTAPPSAERMIHRCLDSYRIRGEWFKRDARVNGIIEVAKRNDWSALAHIVKPEEPEWL